jgi:hydrogenase maturation protease
VGAYIVIIGIGSPFGDDRLGWVAAEMLRAAPALQSAAGPIEILVLDRPGSTLLSHWQNADTVILIDAIRSGQTPGSLHCIAADRIEGSSSTTSSHGFGVAAALDLARALGELPDRCYICGIEVDPAHAGEDLSPTTRAALPALVHRIEGLLSGTIERRPVLSTPA